MAKAFGMLEVPEPEPLLVENDKGITHLFCWSLAYGYYENGLAFAFPLLELNQSEMAMIEAKKRLINDERLRSTTKAIDNHDLLLHPFEKCTETSLIFDQTKHLTKVPHDQKPLLLNTIGHGKRSRYAS